MAPPALAYPVSRYGRRDRANAVSDFSPEWQIIAAEIKAKSIGDSGQGTDLDVSPSTIDPSEITHSSKSFNSLSEIYSAVRQAWQTTRSGFKRLRRREGTGQADASKTDASPAAPPWPPRRLTFGALRQAIPGMSGLFALHGISAVPLILLIFRWPAAQSHNDCDPPGTDQLPAWQIQVLRTAMTFLAIAGSGAYVMQALRRHWPRLSLGGKCIALALGVVLTGVSAVLTYDDKTLTAGRFAAGLADKYLEILVTNGWTVEAGPAAGDARTLTAWGAILTLTLFVTHMIRSGIFIGVEALLKHDRISPTIEVALRAGAKVVSEIATFGVLMPTLMALTNTLFQTQFIVKAASRSIRQSTANVMSRGIRAVTGDDAPMDALRDLYLALKRPLAKREFWSKFVAMPSLGHSTICAGGPTDMNRVLWSLNALGDAGLETIKAYETLSFRPAADKQHDAEALRTISLVGDFLQTSALPSERLRDDPTAEEETAHRHASR
jgi:hypothetical protein